MLKDQTQKKTRTLLSLNWGPAAILFISRDTCSDSIAKRFRARFVGYRKLSRNMLHNEVSHRCACVKLITKGGVSHHFGELLTSLKKYRAMGYRSDSIAMSRDMGPLRWKGHSQSNSRNCTHDLIHAKTLFSEPFSERLPELVGSQISAQILGALFSEFETVTS